VTTRTVTIPGSEPTTYTSWRTTYAQPPPTTPHQKNAGR
jgi:hypothetical protein